MRYILPSRDLIASSVECMVRAHRFDAMVLLGSCDKIVPGLLMAAAGFLSFMDPLAAAVTLSVLAGLFLMIQGVVSIAFGCLSGRFWM